MKLPRRQFLRLAAGAAALPAVSRLARAQAQDFPIRPVRIITHSAPGGSPDALLRIVADRLSQMWGRQVLALGVTTLPDFIALAKSRPGEISYAATGRGTLSHLAGEALQQRADIKLLMVPYLGGTAQALNDVIVGRVPMVIDGYPPLAGALQAGAIRALAVGSTARLPEFPDLPSAAETLPGFNVRGWLALVAPVGTPDAIVRKLSDDLSAAVTDPATKTKLETTGNYPHPMTPAELLAFIHAEQQM